MQENAIERVKYTKYAKTWSISEHEYELSLLRDCSLSIKHAIQITQKFNK